MQNPNRFIRGLSDISDIVDIPCNDAPEVISNTPGIPVVVRSPAPSGVTASSLIQFEQTLSSDGAQVLSVGETIGSSSMLFINGFLQSKSAYSINGASVILPLSLNLFTGDTVTLVYLK